MKKNKFAAFCIGATHSGAGKTTVTLGLLRALYNRGFSVCPFKCGPDYIDPIFHRQAAKQESVNLDTWMMGVDGIKKSWANHCYNADVAVLEGVMGLYDSHKIGNPEGSTADCAKNLEIPVVLLVDAKGMAGSIAAMVQGYLSYSTEISICGIIANRVGSESHAKMLSEALEYSNLPPLLGAIPKHNEFELPERHLGLVPFFENKKSDRWFNSLADNIEKFVNIDLLLKLSMIKRPFYKVHKKTHTKRKTIAYAYDRAFNFYYPDTLQAFEKCGFSVCPFSPLNDSTIPPNVDIVYIGGGFPECFAKQLQQNIAMRESINEYAEKGGVLYAECGGYIYLCTNLKNMNGNKFKMCAIIDGEAEMNSKLTSLGYREVTLQCPTPFADTGDCIRGHEFHWSDISLNKPYKPLFKAVDSRGNEEYTGVQYNNVFASYIHLHLAFNTHVIENLKRWVLGK